MKLWYQTIARQTRWGARSRAMREILDSVKDADTEIELHGTGRGRPESGGADGVDADTVAEILGNVRLAADRGFDAFLIGSIADAALNRTRDIAEIPVLGLCEASLKAASLMGRSFALVTVNPSYTSLIIDNIARYGMADRLAAVQDMGIEHPRDIERGFDDPEIRRRVVAQFQAAAQSSGARAADVVVAAGSVVMALLAYGRIEETIDGTPIIDGIANLVRLGELAVKVNRVIGGRFTADRLDLATEMLRSYDAAPMRRAHRTSLGTVGGGGAGTAFGERRFSG